MSKSDYAIRVEGLGKRYRIGLEQSGGGRYRYKSLRDSLGQMVRQPHKAIAALAGNGPMTEDNSFWALNDVSFDVKKGEVVGIIGRNGAGKSTLLKILSRITKPTTGKIDLYGRVGSLLEVGTGFHPELSGRENIYLNGAILGMSRAEVKAKFDEIVAFSEIEKFLDTPVKQYSSGMYTRLAFAVAAHLEPEILVVDEVLAVGDAQFQKKCMGKMKDVASHGRTVLFVSHNLSQIQCLCNSCLLLNKGKRLSFGLTSEQIEIYSRLDISSHSHGQVRRLTSDLNLMHMRTSSPCIESGDPCIVTLAIRSDHGTCLEDFCILLNSSTDTRLAIADFRGSDIPAFLNAGVDYRFEVVFESLPLVEGEYALGIYCRTTAGLDTVYSIASFEVVNSNYKRQGPQYHARDRGNLELSYVCKSMPSEPKTVASL
ncbi:MAG: ABC transporter ATP-binding protein [Tepidisphaeraceae bacterium]